MSSYKYICTHCGHSFEAESAEPAECPSCYWTSSVKRADEVPTQAAVKTPDRNAMRAVNPFPWKEFAGKIFRAITLLIVGALLLAGIAFLGYQIYAKWGNANKSGGFFIQGQEKGFTGKDEGTRTDSQGLTASENETLHRKIQFSSDLAPSAEEQEILDQTVQFQTGWSEKLPSVAWTLSQYMEMIQQQERFYKMPFARSYKKKLEELFTQKYIPASEAFTRGEILEARDLWVESLAFPKYSEDVVKHRAVALTMLRPFTNDTLAKIGAINQSLMERDRRKREEVLSQDYQNLLGAIRQRDWAKADAVIEQMQTAIEKIKESEPPAPPSYPQGFGNIDQDIQVALMNILSPNPVSSADLEPLKRDLLVKQSVIRAFEKESLENTAQAYNDALQMIQEAKWDGALAQLGRLNGPKVLRDDVSAKIAIIQKIKRALDSSSETS